MTTSRITPEEIDELSICQTCHIVAIELQHPIRGSTHYNQEFQCLSCKNSWFGARNVAPPICLCSDTSGDLPQSC